MRSRTADSHFAVSLHATPSPAHREVFYTVVRAGHLLAGGAHRIERAHFPGHELILCLRGRGWVQLQGRRCEVPARSLVWVNCHQPHAYGADPVDPWELFWIRVEGPRLEQMCSILSAPEAPVFIGIDVPQARRILREIFRQMRGSSPQAPAVIHAEVARLLALVFCARRPREDQAPVVPAVLQRAVERMKLYYFERLTVAELARLSGMSPTHFARTFRAAFGTSPIDWLRRERISQAKHRLAESEASIKEIAAQIGYRDRYFFSKDFRRLTGFSPREFRRREQQAPASGAEPGS